MESADANLSNSSSPSSLETSAPPFRKEFWTRLQPQWVYLFLATLFGIPFIIVAPPLQIPDEENHFYRALQLSEGRVISVKEGNSTGDYLPRSLLKFRNRFAEMVFHSEEKISTANIFEARADLFDRDDREFKIFSNTAVQPPLVHLPQAFGILVARQFTSSILVMFYAGRLCNFLVATALFFCAIRRTPIGKWIFTVLALTPMNLHLMASLSSDAQTNALSFMFIAQILYCALGTERSVSNKNLCLMVLLAIAIGLTKQAYFFLSACYLLIPIAKLGTARRYWAGLIVITAVTILSAASWGFIVRQIYSPINTTPGVDPRGQFLLMLAEPLVFLNALLMTLSFAWIRLQEYIGVLGWLDTWLPQWVIVAELIAIMMVCVGDFDPRYSLSTWQALLAIGIALVIGFIVLVAVYLTWDPVGNSFITTQGRYYIPIGPLVLIAFSQLCNKLMPSALAGARPFIRLVPVALIPLLLTASLATTYTRYFVDSDEEDAEHYFNSAMAHVQKESEVNEAISDLEKAVQKNPQHVKAHILLGDLLTKRFSSAGREHFRTAIRLEPTNADCLRVFAYYLYLDGDYDEAIQIFQKALRLSPGNDILLHLLQNAQNVGRMMSLVNQTLLQCVQEDMLERRHQGTDKDGLYIKPSQGIVDLKGRSMLLKVPFVWRVPPPDKSEIRLQQEADILPESRQLPFYACSAELVEGKRVFVFPAPLNTVLLNDKQISWFFQKRLIDLTDAELEQEQKWRAKHPLPPPSLLKTSIQDRKQ